MPKNIILFTIDSLRFDEHQRLNDRLKLESESLEFSKAFATGPGTTSSFPALLTGTLPLSHGGLGPLVASRPRLSKKLQTSGLTTAGFQCNPFLSRHFNYHHGYDTFKDYQNPLMGIATKIFPRGIEIRNSRFRR
ncbi:MAG: sulfatase-like hydrolase/transferase, partial [Halobacteriaceae archaeon]